jgi:alkylation response protein AidB-like acyl-CoA dehydrogenase
MHFAFTEQQIEFRDAVRAVLAKECTTDDLRAAYAAPSARTRRWTTLADMGVVGLSTPTRHGGLGLGLVDLVPLLEEAGRVALPEPLLETAALAAPLLAELTELSESGELTESGELAGARSEGAADPARWLEAMAAGNAAAAVGPVSGDGAPVAAGEGADLFVLAAVGGPDGVEVHALGAGAVTVTVTAVASLDPTRRLAAVDWSPTPGTRLASGPVAAAALIRMADRAAVATAAELLGLSERMITMAADYAKERHQFGQPIGGFQAVKHLLAGAQVKLEFARPLVYGAAWALDHDEPTASRASSTAKAYASDAATEAARVALQVHGAIGYTWECDLHLFLKRAWALSEAWGSAADHRAAVLASLVAG